ncbi:MAG: DUF4294 domain-containing protein, partial [Flavobacteriales bacterium]|nr:DUF4294 domain-containing protein [Flavobacteriales bacterium]
MLNVLRSLFLIVALGFSLSSLAQKSDSLQKVKPGYAGVSIVKGDTIRNYMLEDITVVASDSAYKAKYDRYVRYIRRAYPYAMLAKQIATEMDTDLLQVNSKKQSKKMVKEEYEALKEKFTDGIKILTVNEGKVLMKLIYRETGMTAYELTDKYLGTGKAFMWQAISRSG